MILCDTGPLVALIDRDDPYHTQSVATLSTLPAGPLLTTWPCPVEAMYLLWRLGSLRAQEELRSSPADGLVVLHTPETREWERMQVLMRQYHDSPMDLADASLVVVADQLNLRRIFTLDSHFRAYQINGTYPSFEVVP